MNRLRATSFVVLLVSLTLVWHSGLQLGRIASRDDSQELLYLPNGKYLKLLSLGHESLLADLIYLWSIQYYSDYRRADRYHYVEHVFGNVISELDPLYTDPYWLGALILIVEAGDLEAGLRLLDKGAELNPREWILPYLEGWECYRVERFEDAAAYFERAAAVPGAPAVVRRLRAGMFSRAGEIETSIRLWTEVLEDPDSDEASQAIAQRQVRELRESQQIQLLTEAIQRFRTDNGRNPRTLEELVQRSYIPHRMLAPEGRPFDYDASTGRVGSIAGRVLGRQ